ncbi:MAG: histidine kinase dimerization/phospho-acceptor domain-containing protein, partial [Myxococcota bacterium]
MRGASGREALEWAEHGRSPEVRSGEEQGCVTQLDGPYAAIAAQLRQANRFSTIGALTASLVHAMSSPLTVVATYANLIGRDDASVEETRDGIAAIADQAAQMTQIVRQLVEFSRQSQPDLPIYDVAGVIRRTAGLLDTLARKRKVVLQSPEHGDEA